MLRKAVRGLLGGIDLLLKGVAICVFGFCAVGMVPVLLFMMGCCWVHEKLKSYARG